MVTTSQQVTIFQLPQATLATAGREYILTILDTQPVSVPVVQPTQTATTQPATVIAKVQQPQGPASVSAQPTSYLVVHDQQPGTSRQLMFTFSPTKTVNPPSVAASQQEESQHNTEGFPVYCNTSRSTRHNYFHPLNFNQHHHQCHLPLIKNSQDLPASPPSKASPNEQISLHNLHQQALLRATRIFQNNYSAVVAQKQKNTPSNTYTSTKNTKLVRMNESMLHKK